MIFRKFAEDARGNFALATAGAMVMFMGGVALAIDYSEMIRQRQAVHNALDAAGVATARRIAEGATEAQVLAYAKDFFEANLGPVAPANATLNVVLPSSEGGGGTLKLSAQLKYKPYFYPVFTKLLEVEGGEELHARASTAVRLQNTLEVALALDNSGSMDKLGAGSGEKRIDLLKAAAKQLVDTISVRATQMKQVVKPVQFGLVPFAASVNVGPANASAAWMDIDGISPIHHENFDWSTFNAPDKTVENVLGVYYKKGSGWGSEAGQKVTRFSLFSELKYYTDSAQKQAASYAGWGGCVETRPHPYGTSDAAPTSADPATLFVPMFAPDETDLKDGNNRSAYGNWWPDATTGASLARQSHMPKYFLPRPYGSAPAGQNAGPNISCSTKPITPLLDVSTAEGLEAIKGAIDAMAPLGGTNVPEGMAWGWRVVSSGEPFTQGRPEGQKGNDKVVIVLTDGENTYYTPESLGKNDLAGNGSIYSNYGYAKRGYTSPTRIFQGTSGAIPKTSFTNSNYTNAVNEHFATLCGNVKSAKVIVMTVALDLNSSNAAEAAQIEALRACSSDSRFRKDSSGKPAKLFWNATGSDLAEKFKEIADELSNLRIVS